MRHEIFDALLLLSCVYALLRGGAPERIASLIFLAADMLSVMLVSGGVRFGHEEYGVFAVDLFMLASLAALAFRSRRWWPILLAGLQLDGVLVHLVHFTVPQTIPIAYLNAVAIWSYPMMLMLVAGTRRHQMRVRRSGEDLAWKTFVPIPRASPDSVAEVQLRS